MALAVHAEGLSKRYRLGPGFGAGSTFREALTSWLRAAAGAVLPSAHWEGSASGRSTEFWALQDVSFEVAEGERIGIVGANGAGKSTLLKILSRVTEPTRGRVMIAGRVASLLEVGTGFHPELSGRENVYLNGALLGMTRSEIRRKFDDIIGFAGVERFLDTPVKRYSSGMYVRLAFSVAAHLDSDILVVDEVLAVGDAQFQRKSLGRMGELSRTGRTVLFVSHNMGAISQLCDRALWLHEGSVRAWGPTRDVIGRYLAHGAQSGIVWRPLTGANEASAFNYESVSLRSVDSSKLEGTTLPADTGFQVVFEYSVAGPLAPGRIALAIRNAEGTLVLASANTDGESALNRRWKLGASTAHCVIPGHLLAPGRYTISISEPRESGGDLVHDSVLSFEIDAANSLAERDGRGGVVMPVLAWHDEGSGI